MKPTKAQLLVLEYLERMRNFDGVYSEIDELSAESIDRAIDDCVTQGLAQWTRLGDDFELTDAGWEVIP